MNIRTAYHGLRERCATARGVLKPGADIFLNELIWREFYYQILANFPHVVRGAFRHTYDALEWSSNERHLEAWRSGRTGYPVVDAAMRQLRLEGWMHNRGRMVVASFLTKDLRIDWRRGEEYFMEHLADGDAALNNGGWQWCSGTGNDAQPWFRIFNPVLQSKKFDPAGEYIKRYVPELENIPARYIHEPWLMPRSVQQQSGCLIGKHYPAPIVDHDRERKRTLEIYSRIARSQSAPLEPALMEAL
jgi:deoxyribodipyrimidine photo-lyase